MSCKKFSRRTYKVAKTLGCLSVVIALQGNAFLFADDLSNGLNEAAGVNLTAEEGFGARQSARSITFAGYSGDADAVANAPAAMNDVNDFTFSVGHLEKFGTAKFDHFNVLFPFQSNSTLGLGLSRFGVNDIEKRVGVVGNFTEPDGYFSSADYLIVGALARHFGDLDIGANLHMLYRQLDQSGVGLRGDVMAQYTVAENFRVNTLIKGALPSSAHWSSGYTEYQPTDVFLGCGLKVPAEYFYGELQIALQTEGLFQQNGKSPTSLTGGRIHESPLDILTTTNLGLEYIFDFGLALRAGTNNLDIADLMSVFSLGLGYSWRHIVTVDYSFAPAPGLLAAQRISIQCTPSFAHFNGLNYRGHNAKTDEQKKSPISVPQAPSENGEMEEAVQEEELPLATRPKTEVQLTRPVSPAQSASTNASPKVIAPDPSKQTPAADEEPKSTSEVLEKEEIEN